MSITGYNQTRIGNVTRVTVSSSLSGTVWFHWYLDGAYVGGGQRGSREFHLPDGEMVRVDVLDTNDANFDPIANAPVGWPARKTLWWVRSQSNNVAHYRVEQKLGAGSWTQIAIVPHRPTLWSYATLTSPLDDLGSYTWQVIPVDTAGNDGSPLTFGPQTIVRIPDAPNFAIEFDEGTTKVTFSDA